MLSRCCNRQIYTCTACYIYSTVSSSLAGQMRSALTNAFIGLCGNFLEQPCQFDPCCRSSEKGPPPSVSVRSVFTVCHNKIHCNNVYFLVNFFTVITATWPVKIKHRDRLLIVCHSRKVIIKKLRKCTRVKILMTVENLSYVNFSRRSMVIIWHITAVKLSGTTI